MVTIDGYVIDAAPVQDHQFDSDITEHPVESGANVADHVRTTPIVLTIEGIVSDTPIGELAESRGDALPSTEAFERLKTIRAKREPVTVETHLGTYENMILQSLSTPVAESDALKFRATFREIVFVTTERTVVPVEVPRAQKKKNRGHKPAKEIDLAAAAKTASGKVIKKSESMLHSVVH